MPRAFRAASRRRPTTRTPRKATRSARRTTSRTASKSPPASTTSSGTASSRTSTSRGNCGLQFTDNLGTAVAKGFDMQADADLGGGLSVEASVGYTERALHQELGKATSPSTGDAISGEAAINYSPGHESALDRRDRAAVQLHASWSTTRSCAPTGNTTSRNPWLAPVQDPRSSAVRSDIRTRCPRPASPRCAPA